jgi:phage tail tube protein FII
MANLWLDLKGPILADTVYVDGVLAAKDVTIALPPVNLVTADFKAMGTYTAPLPGQIEAMEASITKIGIDLGLRSLVKLTSKTIEIRWAQDVKLSDGSTKTEGCKAFLRCVSKGIPGLNVDPGNASENEIALAVSRYQLFVAGNEKLADRPAQHHHARRRRRLRQGHPQRPVTRRASPPGRRPLFIERRHTWKS